MFSNLTKIMLNELTAIGSVKSGGSNMTKDTVMKQDTRKRVPIQKKTECLVSR